MKEITVLSPPLFIKGPVVKGFGRGSKTLGIPTANFDEETLRAAQLDETLSGVYAGFASVGADPAIYKTVLSIGWNPHFKNEKRTAESWILHDFGRDFYGEELRLFVVAYIREEKAFTSLDALVERIHQDADLAQEMLVPFSGACTFLKPSV